MRLSNATLGQVRPPVRTPAYDRAKTTVGVVHFGPGAFHRAHQAWYFDRMLAHDPGLAVCAVSLRTPDVRDALSPQDGLYALVEKEADPTVQVIGAIREVLVAPEDPDAVFARLAEARYVTATVTEKGYCLTTAGALDLDHPDIRRDLANPDRPVTAIGWICEALRRRKAVSRQSFTTISCDNLSDNGAKLGRAVAAFARARGEPALAAWIEANAAFPCSMVDSITPATDDALRAQADAALGLVDAWPVQRERFVQWVVEDRLGADRPLFERAGVTVARDVAPFERAKLRLLNGAHSTLAYVGLALGHETVSAAMADPRLSSFVERMMRQDVSPTLDAPELDIPVYVDAVLARFRNPAIVHKLSQIAWDGSQKLRFRLLETAAEALAAGRPADRLAVGVAAWIAFVIRQARAGAPLTDPLAGTLVDLARQCDGALADVDRFLALESVFPPALAAEPSCRTAVARAYARLTAEPHAILSL
ncbi:mannitol dehydrogenase family protein [Phenylobacterium sp.]|uniref:mannitol dehydrogenase family protein n=1 Tax=Phenylobacterium sp. TaxID=1871053 RepID=UPI0025E6CC75|nr:mannitol dehydrogenase family protein [Phenylobacterium sp.]